jgi:hypothetical protein
MISIFVSTAFSSATSVCPQPTTLGTVFTDIGFSELLNESKNKDLFYRLNQRFCIKGVCKAVIDYESDDRVKVIDIQCDASDAACNNAAMMFGPSFYFWKKNASSPIRVPREYNDCLGEKIQLLVKGCDVPTPAAVKTITYEEYLSASNESSTANEIYKIKAFNCQVDCDDMVVAQTAGFEVYTVVCSNDDVEECKAGKIAANIYSRSKGVATLNPLKSDPFVCISDLIPIIFPQKLSKGAKAGIAVGIICFLLLVGGGIGGFFWWRKSQN